MANKTKQKLEWHTERRLVKDLLPWDGNPRKLSDEQAEQLKISLDKFNLVELPAIDTNNRLVAGHQRVKVLLLLNRGEEEIEVRVPNRKLTETEFKEYNLRSNRNTGEWDFDKLKDFDLDLLLDVGFDDTDLSNIWDDTLEAEDDGFDVEKELTKIKKPVTNPGEMFQLGPHRLICGDSTNPAVVARVMGKELADMIYCDPPFNISLDYDKGIGMSAGKYGGIHTNDSKTDPDYRRFLKATMENALLAAKPDVHMFYFCDEAYIGMVQGLYEELGLKNRRVCIWLKNNQNPTPQIAFNKVYEPNVYATRGKPFLNKKVLNLNEVMNKEVGSGNRLVDDVMDLLNIWLVKRLPSQDYHHPTEKSPTLHEKALRRCTKPGDLVVDLFAGSGSTMVACNQLKRRCFLVEAEPIFCDLIIKRYEALTHTKAKKLN